MNLSSVDLNLLVALDALLAERSVSRAALRLGLSQPATSHALARLRAHFGDPLFVRTPEGMVPTPRAMAVAEPLRVALEAARAAFEGPRKFEPSRAERLFRLSVADGMAALLLPTLVERVSQQAPSVDLALSPVAQIDAVDRMLLDGALDAALVPTTFERAGIQRRLLWKERFVCVLRAGHPLSRRRSLSLDEWLALRHLLVAPRGAPGSIVDDALAAKGRRRRVALQVPQFLLAPTVIERSDLAWTAPARVAEALASRFELVIKPLPIELEGFSVFLRWHERFDRDEGHRWLRAKLIEASRSLRSSDR